MDISALKILLTLCALLAALLMSLSVFLVCVLVCRTRSTPTVSCGVTNNSASGAPTHSCPPAANQHPTVDNWLVTLSLTGGGFMGALGVVYMVYNGLGLI
ncbi:hypothetical protein [Actinoplanes sp. NPDC051859]|uniref:hypothetical protein n=1 Tax=Actinoplanes sp. NPDC051859 TaxID=3363909 RepID=UPI0037B1E7D4